LFDWDGTIVDSVPSLFETDCAVCRTFGLPMDPEIYRRTFSPNWRRKYETWGIRADQIDQAVAVWASLFNSSDHPAFPGITSALRRLAECGYVLGVVTSGSRSEIEPQFQRLGLADLLTVGVFGDEPIPGKPAPDPLRLALERAGGIAPENAFYLGDALDDVRMAVAAGVAGIGIESMLADEADLRAVGAAETAASVVEWVDRLLGSAG
jgi:HAD superfamily hydrolase (TIGR01549 family)